VKFHERTQALPNETKQWDEYWLSLRWPSSSKSWRNPNEELVPNTATTVAKPNFQGSAHNIIQKGVFTRRHTRTRQIITKARTPNAVFRSCVGLSTHINTFDFSEYSRKGMSQDPSNVAPRALRMGDNTTILYLPLKCSTKAYKQKIPRNASAINSLRMPTPSFIRKRSVTFYLWWYDFLPDRAFSAVSEAMEQFTTRT